MTEQRKPGPSKGQACHDFSQARVDKKHEALTLTLAANVQGAIVHKDIFALELNEFANAHSGPDQHQDRDRELRGFIDVALIATTLPG
jgi:hypothetical protein